MNYIKHLRGFYQRVESDENITAHHISLYMALFQVWNIQRFRKRFDIIRQDLMAMSRIGSAHTYARCMKQLNDWGYIEYAPPSNRFSASQVSCARFDITNGTATGTADDTASNTTCNTANCTASSTLFINNTNYTKDKQKNPGFFDFEKRKKEKIKNPYHVAIEKDYSEPL
mgnify:CR=1 FL=1